MILTKADVAKLVLGFLRCDVRPLSERKEVIQTILALHGLKHMNEIRDEQIESIAEKVMVSWHPV